MDGMNKLISLLRDNVYICGIGIVDEYYHKWDTPYGSKWDQMNQNLC
jgi:hypothetical protein